MHGVETCVSTKKAFFLKKSRILVLKTFIRYEHSWKPPKWNKLLPAEIYGNILKLYLHQLCEHIYLYCDFIYHHAHQYIPFEFILPCMGPDKHLMSCFFFLTETCFDVDIQVLESFKSRIIKTNCFLYPSLSFCSLLMGFLFACCYQEMHKI